MNEHRLNLLGNVGAFLRLASDLRPPVLWTITGVRVRPVKSYSLKSVVIFSALSVRHVELAQTHDIVSVLSPGLVNSLALCPILGRVKGLCSQVIIY